MKRRKNSKMILAFLVSVVFLGIGYAAIAGVNLVISGTTSVKSSDGNFLVRFVKNDASETAIENAVTNAITISGKNIDDSNMDVSGMSASVEDDTHASFTAGELDEVGEYVDFTYTVVNESDGIDSMLSFDVEDVNDAENYFEISKTTDKSIISEGEVAKVTVRVKLVNRPVVDDFDGSFTVTLVANPVEEEDFSERIVGTTGGVINEATFAKAVQSEDVNTIKLEDDITVEKKTIFAINDDTTIDLNGHTLTLQSDSLKVTDGAELTLTSANGNGGIKAEKNAVTVENGSELIVESGTYETTEYTGRGSVFTIPSGADNAKITINGGTINAEYFAISSYGNSEVEINGGEITSTATVKNTDSNGKTYHAYAVRLSAGHLTMNGGTVEGIHGGIGIIGSATATINDGTVILNNSYEGAKDSYYCLYVEGNASAEVLGGTFTNNGTNPLVYSSSTGLVNLRGGSWTGKSTKAFNGTPNAGKDSIKVYGGTYKKNTSGTLTDYSLTGYSVN